MFQPHSETSRNAWRNLETGDKDEDRIYKIVEGAGVAGICAPRVAEILDMQAGTVAARVIGLERHKRIIKLERTEKSPSGKPANVMVAAKFRPDLAAHEKILNTKPEGQPTGNAQDYSELFRKIDAHITSGFPIYPQSEIHKEVLAALADSGK